MVEVTQEDREAAASGYYAWCSGNPVIPNRILGGDADDHSMVQAFARHRQAAIKERDAEIVAWLRNRKEMTDRYIDYVETAQAADCIEAGEV